MRSRLRRVFPALAGVVLLAGLAGQDAAQAQNRALERVVAKGMFNADDVARVQRSFAAALKAGVEQRDGLKLVEACVDGEFDAQQTLRVLSIIAQLSLEGLPVDGFVAKIEEGVSKRVAADRVVQVGERRALMLNQAKLILNALVLQGFTVEDRDRLLPDLAAALEAGRPADEVRRILSAALEAGEPVGKIRDKLFP